MKNLLAIFLVMGIFSALYSQEQFKIVKVKSAYLVINRGSTDGIKSGDRFKVRTPDKDDQEFGEIEVIKTSQTVSAVELIMGVPEYTLKVGDIVILSEGKTVDELLNETTKQASKETKIESLDSPPRSPSRREGKLPLLLRKSF